MVSICAEFAELLTVEELWALLGEMGMVFGNQEAWKVPTEIPILWPKWTRLGMGLLPLRACMLMQSWSVDNMVCNVGWEQKASFYFHQLCIQTLYDLTWFLSGSDVQRNSFLFILCENRWTARECVILLANYWKVYHYITVEIFSYCLFTLITTTTSPVQKQSWSKNSDDDYGGGGDASGGK